MVPVWPWTSNFHHLFCATESAVIFCASTEFLVLISYLFCGCLEVLDPGVMSVYRWKSNTFLALFWSSVRKKENHFFPSIGCVSVSVGVLRKNNAGVPIEIRVNFRRFRPTCPPLKAKISSSASQMWRLPISAPAYICARLCTLQPHFTEALTAYCCCGCLMMS